MQAPEVDALAAAFERERSARVTAPGRDVGGRPMRRQLQAVLLVALTGAIAGCQQADKQPTPELLGWLEVQGTCREDHVTQSDRYVGELVGWRNKTTGKAMRYGSVTDANEQTEIARLKDPTKYHPPFMINFEDVPEKEFGSASLILHGVASNDDNAPGYRATCSLTVDRRLDHVPTDAERKELRTPSSGTPIAGAAFSCSPGPRCPPGSVSLSRHPALNDPPK